MKNYKISVLAVNKELKLETKTLSGAIKMLQLINVDNIKDKETKSATIKAHQALKTVDYGKLKKACRKSKSGNYAPFYVLQALYKLELI